MGSTAASAWLVVVEEEAEGAHHPVGQGTTLIGRGSSCDIVLAIGSVSRKHAQIVSQGDQFFIYDLGSTNGTFVDGQMTGPSKGSLLNDGSVISIGEVSLLFKEA